MKVSSGNYKAPFKADGSVPHWLMPCDSQNVHWEPVQPFEAKIRFDNVVPTNYGRRFEVVNVDTNARYCVFNRDIKRLEQRFNIWNDVISGWWKVQKYGQNYGIYYLGEDI